MYAFKTSAEIIVNEPKNIFTLTGNNSLIRKFKDLIEERTGNYFNENRENLVVRAVQERMQEIGLKSQEEYFTFLKIIPNFHLEWRDLISAITNNESYFFREYHQFETLEKEIIPQLKIQSYDTIRILSAACSEGQEVYSCNMALKESGIGSDYQIYGIDIDEKALNKAKSGKYSQYSFREEKFSHLYRKYFNRIGEDYQISEEMKSNIRFVNASLINQNQLSMLPEFDVIFCRNVLIYFREDNFKLAIDNLFRLLKPGGYLFLGHSESALGLNPNLVPVSFNSFIGYKKI